MIDAWKMGGLGSLIPPEMPMTNALEAIANE
jgi:hypothetical protein